MEKRYIERKSFKNEFSQFHVDNLLEMQISSYESFLQKEKMPEEREIKGLEAVLKDYFPLQDAKEKNTLYYDGYELGVPKYSIKECKERGISYGAPLKIKFSLVKDKTKKKTDEQKFEKIENSVYLGDMPLMTKTGSFVINGAERVIISQIHRSPGIFFGETIKNNKRIINARIIPYRGSWVEFFIDATGIYLNLGSSKKIPVTVLLKALHRKPKPENFDPEKEEEFTAHLETDFESIVEHFIKPVEVSIASDDIEEYIGKIIFEDVVDSESGEVFAEKYSVLDQNAIQYLLDSGVDKIKILNYDKRDSHEILLRTFLNDKCETRMDALANIYNLIRTGEPPSELAAESIMERIFFSVRRYDLGEIGRYRLNKRLYDKEDADEEGYSTERVLEVSDIYRIVELLIDFYNKDVELDDIDHLSNRRIRPVGELIEHRFAVALGRLTKLIKEKLSTTKDIKNINELVNARAVYTVLMSFFQTSQLSQFMDQTNPLSELTNKRRLSSLGPGGLTRERAGFEVRDVHYTHYGKICPIETPEGPNIGLIVSLANFSRVNRYGFLMTPYFKVEKGVLTDKMEYLLAEDEEKYFIAPADIKRDENNKIISDDVITRKKGEYVHVQKDEVDYMDVSTIQTVSVSASLIPFLEHDDANRALMGSNMQRQGVPLLFPSTPIVGTGMEKKAAVDSGAVVTTDVSGTVIYSDSTKIVIRPSKEDKDEILYNDFIYELRKFERSNQNTCINQRPLVKEGEKVKKGAAIADGMATEKGELALGKNPIVAFMCWNGYNFEDAIIQSQELLKSDFYTSVHIQEFDVEVRDTKRGPEELTREIPNYSEEAVKNLDEDGIIMVGARVKPGDIIVGKVTPKGETDLSPEEKLLRAIFGERAGDVRDTSLRADPGMKGVVIGTKLLTRKKQTNKSKVEDRKKIEALENDSVAKSKHIISQRTEYLIDELNGESSRLLLDKYSKKVVVPEGKEFDSVLIKEIRFENIDLSNGIIDDEEKNARVVKLIKQSIKMLLENEKQLEMDIDKVMRGDELKPDVIKLVKVYIATKKKLSVGDKFAGRHGNKGVVSIIVPESDMPFMENGKPVQTVLNPLGIPSRMNIGQLLETHLGWAAYNQGFYVKVPVFNSASVGQIKNELINANLPGYGKMKLRDGKTGEYFDNEVTVGIMYMMKLNHLVADKVHARSIGPYSLITQQPLGGKSQFGGQRFGEMEVWAIEAYGASFLLQELLTAKSDDTVGRVKIYESIVRDQNLPEFGIPESFKVLISEIRSLGIDIYVE